VLTSPSIALKVRPGVLSIGTQGQLGVRPALPVVALQTSDHTQERGPPVS
jgi:hypothetical protein